MEPDQRLRLLSQALVRILTGFFEPPNADEEFWVCFCLEDTTAADIVAKLFLPTTEEGLATTHQVLQMLKADDPVQTVGILEDVMDVIGSFNKHHKFLPESTRQAIIKALEELADGFFGCNRTA